MNEAPEGWVVYQQRDVYAPGIVLYTIWASADGIVEIRPSGAKFALVRTRAKVSVGIFMGKTREACAAWWAIEKSNEAPEPDRLFIQGESKVIICWDETSSISDEALEGILECRKS